ncbi:endolytic transglycosylase MltG [Aerococcaceae bacterium DSM 111176]|nr:endolytic transglycosylase MltG [Aerococcaceae bacterium DSM 111176]
MNKNTMRSMGVGVLISAVLLGGYTLFTEENTTTNTEGENTELLASLESENSQLKSDQLSLNDEIAQLREDGNQSSQSSSSSQSSASESDSSDESDDESAASEETDENGTTETTDTDTENDTEDTESVDEDVETDEDGLATPAESGTFTIAEGSDTTTIAQQLQDEGYIDSADELTSLIEEWGLETVIGAGDYELNSDMSIHDIANIITQGAYYYY